MENRTTFNLNKSIQDWKIKLSQNPNMTIDNVEELESHLLDEIAELQSTGLNEEEAFMVAKKRIGSVDNIAAEFAKVNRNHSLSYQVLPYLRGMLVYVAILGVAKCFFYISILITGKIYDLPHIFKLYFPKMHLLLPLIILLIGSLFFLVLNKMGSLKKLTEIPTLIAIIIINCCLQFIMNPDLIDFCSIYPSLHAYLNIFSFYFILTLVMLSYITNKKTKRKSKMVIS